MTATPPPPAWRPPAPLPDPVAETGRLRIRWYLPGDAPALHAAVDAGREALTPFLPWVATSHRYVGESRRFIEHVTAYRAQVTADDFVMALFDPSDGTFVGGSGFHRIDPLSATAEIGYWIRPDLWGRGYATEASRALLDAGFRAWGFRRIKLCCASHNDASIRVIEKVGGRLEAIEREERWLDGFGWSDSLTYAILASEWDADALRGPGGRSLGA